MTIPSRVTYSGKSYTVRSISDYAFAGCPSVRTVSIPHTISSVGKYTFANCIALCKVSISDLEAWCRINFAEGGNPLIYAHHLFLNEREVHHLVIPNTVSQIGQYAFCGCHGIVSAQIGIGVTSIGDYAFAECTSLESILIPRSVTSIGEYAFTGCRSLPSLVLPNSVATIGKFAFADCTNIKSIAIPASVTVIGNNVMRNCSKLEQIVVAQGNAIFDSRDNCNAVIETASNTLILGCKRTFIPATVTSIGESAFFGCRGLTAVTIPHSVTAIGGGAFAYCTGLRSLTVLNEVPPTLKFGESTFTSIPSSCVLYVPSQSRAQYRSAYGWRYFSNL